MKRPRVFADFHNTDAEGRVRLNCIGTIEDLSCQRIELTDGQLLTIYCEALEVDGTVQYSEVENIWVAKIDWKRIKLSARPSLIDKPSLWSRELVERFRSEPATIALADKIFQKITENPSISKDAVIDCCASAIMSGWDAAVRAMSEKTRSQISISLSEGRWVAQIGGDLMPDFVGHGDDPIAALLDLRPKISSTAIEEEPELLSWTRDGV